MIVMQVNIQVKPERQSEFEMNFAQMLPELSRHPGVLAMDLSRSVERPGEYFLIEKYADEGALRYHQECPACKTFGERVAALQLSEPVCSRYEEAVALSVYRR